MINLELVLVCWSCWDILSTSITKFRISWIWLQLYIYVVIEIQYNTNHYCVLCASSVCSLIFLIWYQRKDSLDSLTRGAGIWDKLRVNPLYICSVGCVVVCIKFSELVIAETYFLCEVPWDILIAAIAYYSNCGSETKKSPSAYQIWIPDVGRFI